MPQALPAIAAFAVKAFTSAVTATSVALTKVGVMAAIGEGATIALAQKIVITAAVTAASAGMAAIMRPSTPSSGMTLDFKPDPKAPITGMMGYAATGGNRVFQSTWGYNNVVLTLGAALSLGPIAERPTFYADNVPVSFDPAEQNEAIGFYKADMWQTTVLGRPGVDPHPTVPTGLKYGNPPLSGWNAPQNPVGVAFSLWTMVLAKNPEDRDIFTNGEPNPRWVGQWMKVYDWRKDSTYPGGSGPQRENLWNTWEYSENPYVHARAFLRGHYKMLSNGAVDFSKRLAGVGAPVSAIDMGAFTEGANLADANNWVISGGWTSTDSKWDVLTSMLKAGGGIPIQSGAQVSVMLNAPRVSTTTIDRNDIVGEINIQPLTRRRERKNTIIPRYRSEAHSWEYVPAGPVTSTVYREEDNDELRSLEIQYNYVRLPQQAAQLAAYDLANLREGIKITATLKIDALGIAAGDCVTFDVPEVGLASQKFVVLRKTVDYQSATITVECRSETDGKHAWAMGQAANPPPTPSLSGVDPRYMPPPQPDDWVVLPLPPGEDGVETPIIVAEGETGTTDIQGVIIEYGLPPDPPPPDPLPEGAKWEDYVTWNRVFAGAPSLNGRYEFTVQPPGATFYTSIQYIANNGTISDRYITGPLVASGLVSQDTTHIGGVPVGDIPALDTTPPANPSGLALSSGSVTDSAGNPSVSITATWTANTEPDLSFYEIEITESGFTVVEPVITRRYTRPALTGRTYSIRVRAVDRAGNRSGWTASQNIVGAGDTTPPAAPASFTVATSLGSFFLEWVNPSASDLSKIEVWENTVNNSGTATRIATVNAMPSARGGFTRSGLSSGDTRWFWIKAVDTSGNASVFSAAVTATLPTVPSGEIDTTPPGVPTGLSLSTNTVIDAGTGQPRTIVVATWTGPGDSDLAGYDVEVTEAGSNPVIRLVAGPRDEWTTRPNVSFSVRVRAFDRVGNRSAFTAQQSITTSRDTTAPAAPTGLVSVASVGSIFLSGTAPSDSDLEKIEVWENTTNNSSTATRIAVVNAMPGLRWSHPRTGLSANDTRWYWAKAVDTSGNVSAFSTGISQTVPYVANPDIAVGTLAGDRIMANSIEGSKFITNTSLPGTITVGSTGVTIETVQNYASDPAARINTGPVTQIVPGKIQISGATTLADWRMGGDETRINGGSISTNTITANKLSVGLRGVVANITFTTNSPGANQVSWSAGSITYINDSGVSTTATTAAGSTTYSGTPRAIWWNRVSGNVNSGAVETPALNPQDILLAVYYGGTLLIDNHGRTIIEGDQIRTGGITANNIAAGAVTAGKLAANSVAADNIQGGVITGDKFNTSTSLPGTITVGSTGVSIGTVQSQAANPAGTINSGTTLIEPGKVQISGLTTLSDWRQGGDLTKIAGGSISANTVTANKLSIGQRGINSTLTFTANSPGLNQVSWTTGTVSYIDNSGTPVTKTISGGFTAVLSTFPVGIGYNSVTESLDFALVNTLQSFPHVVILAVYNGGTNLVTDYGRTIIEGDLIRTGAVTADKINVTNLSAINANLGTVTAGTLQNTALTYILDLTNGRETSFVGSGGVAYRGNDVGLTSEGIYLWVGPSSITRANARKSNAWLGLSMNTSGGPRFFGSDVPAGGDVTIDGPTIKSEGSTVAAQAGTGWSNVADFSFTLLQANEVIDLEGQLSGIADSIMEISFRLIHVGSNTVIGTSNHAFTSSGIAEFVDVRITGANTWSGSQTFRLQVQRISGTGFANLSGPARASIYAAATTANPGFMTPAQVTLLNSATGGGVTLATTAPPTVGTANAVGVGTTAARADHVHAHGNQAGGSLHSNASTSNSGFMSASDKSKLNGIAAGATANNSDAYLLNRANHTGTQTWSTISNPPAITAETTTESGAASSVVKTTSAGHIVASGLLRTVNENIFFGATGSRYMTATGRSDIYVSIPMTGPAFTPTSDIRLKYDFVSLSDNDAMQRILQIECLEYTRVQDDVRARGFGAQGLRDIDPLYVAGDEIVMEPSVNEEGETVMVPSLDENGEVKRTSLAVDPMAIIADLVAAVRVLEVANGMLESRIAALESK